MKNYSPAIESFLTRCNELCQKNLAANTLQITRSILAIATLLTLCFSSTDTLFQNRLINPLIEYTSLAEYGFFKIMGIEKVGTAKFIFMLVLIFVISGYYKKLTSLLHWYFSLSFVFNGSVIDGGDQITAILCMLIVPISFLDSRKNTWIYWDYADKPSYKIFISNVFFKLLQFQVALIYFISAISKIFIAEWVDGTAYYYWFIDNGFGAPVYLKQLIGFIISKQYIVTSITWGTIIFEITIFCSYFSNNKYFKKLLFKAGVVFHIAIAIIHGIPSFSLAMIGCLFILLRSEVR
jgi:antimicrobial peptide system SdpB family protein